MSGGEVCNKGEGRGSYLSYPDLSKNGSTSRTCESPFIASPHGLYPDQTLCHALYDIPWNIGVLHLCVQISGLLMKCDTPQPMQSCVGNFTRG